MSESSSIGSDLFQLLLNLAITPICIRLCIKAYITLSMYKDSEYLRIDFYIFHMIIYALWAVSGFIQVYFALSQIVLKQLVTDESQLAILLGKGGQHCTSDFFLIFAVALFGYTAILMPINWLEIATAGYVASRDVYPSFFWEKLQHF